MHRMATSETVGAIIVNMEELHDDDSIEESMPGLQERKIDDWSSCDDDDSDDSSYNEWMGHEERSLESIIGGRMNLFSFALYGHADFYQATE